MFHTVQFLAVIAAQALSASGNVNVLIISLSYRVNMSICYCILKVYFWKTMREPKTRSNQNIQINDLKLYLIISCRIVGGIVATELREAHC